MAGNLPRSVNSRFNGSREAGQFQERFAPSLEIASPMARNDTGYKAMADEPNDEVRRSLCADTPLVSLRGTNLSRLFRVYSRGACRESAEAISVSAIVRIEIPHPL